MPRKVRTKKSLSIGARELFLIMESLRMYRKAVLKKDERGFSTRELSEREYDLADTLLGIFLDLEDVWDSLPDRERASAVRDLGLE